MSILSKTLIALALLSLATADAFSDSDRSKRSITELQQKIESTDGELETLAHFTLGGGVGSPGFRSKPRKTADNPEWVQIELGNEFLIDEILIAPVISRNTSGQALSDGFPESFRLIAGTADDSTGTIIAEFNAAPGDLPRFAPLLVPVKKGLASWIRMEVDRPATRSFDNLHLFQLSEIFVFSGEENVALRRPVSASSVHPRGNTRSWGPNGITDGHTPYFIDAADGQASITYISQRNFPQALNIDLQASVPISRIHLHNSGQIALAPHPSHLKLGMPQHLLIEGANRADFSDAKVLLDHQQKTITGSGPIMKWPITETFCRYIRISNAEATATSRIGFAEIELFANGKNVALGKAFTATPSGRSETYARKLSALTDGRNQLGNILPTRLWLEQLARRHGLETERPLLNAELDKRYAHQRELLRIMIWLAGLLLIATAFTLLISRILRMRNEIRLRERFAADLHDELGANIHTIGLLGDLARDAESHDELIELLDRSRVFTERSGAAVRNCTSMLEAQGRCKDLPEEIKRSSERLLADLKHEISFDGEAFLKELTPRKRIDLFLFHKECLNNIIRHSGATQVSIQLHGAPKKIMLSITDNGIGLGSEVPPSLKRRARIMGARVISTSPAAGGTCITLQLRRRGSINIFKKDTRS